MTLEQQSLAIDLKLQLKYLRTIASIYGWSEFDDAHWANVQAKAAALCATAQAESDAAYEAAQVAMLDASAGMKAVA